ncbi:hypothetical protein [Diaphorobacter caeni]|uniref:hypothetical protein n=1 Tax=Diaphorobacter caeni TaxID=2784387 RepID=UPI00188FBF10|nr:hypothetical protein [Diaphorobacter caeni]MBF5005594.1 hypothetical protein [Diaphorobacter caeni]
MDLNAAVRADSLTLAEFQSMDTETMLYFVQLKRATDLEDKLRGKMEKVAKNIDDHGADSTKINDNLNEIARIEKTGRVDPSKFDATKDRELLNALQSSDAEGFATLTSEQLSSLNHSGRSTSNGKTTEYQIHGGNMSVTISDGEKKVTKSSWVTPQPDGTFKIKILPELGPILNLHIETRIAITENSKDSQAVIDKAISDLKTENESLKVKVDTATNLQQLDMIELQQLMTNMNQAFDMVSNAMKKFAETKGGIIRNT